MNRVGRWCRSSDRHRQHRGNHDHRATENRERVGADESGLCASQAPGSAADQCGEAVDDAIAANPDVAAKVRDGKVAAVGVLVGAVRKATRGQADAARVRELILQRRRILR